ncbi:hypothetical protein [Conexibacter woesei]|uniref:hypothetical protein n=1 Tax=Conexibacter woesei TaxID=191495 RepID=UPI000406B462|nr:hypothetical protein [Conexibacter woesei]
MSDTAQLLETYQPHLKYDQQEMYFADAAEMFVRSPGMRLRRAGDATDFKVAGAGLDLAFLSSDPYPGTQFRWAEWDTLGCPDRNYASRAATLHMDPNIANVVYGHVVEDSDRVTWLQYWYCYFYNDYNLIGRIIRAGLHEGDWEMVQLRLGGPDRTPDLAVYAQHRHAEPRAWSRVEKVAGTQRPVVYVARGSHAAYFAAGRHWTGVWFDHADGRRASPDRQRLVEVVSGDATRRWIRWLGHWGDTRSAGAPQDDDSPRSPGVHRQWLDPLALLDAPPAAAPAVEDRPPAPAAPRIAVARTGETARLTWDATGEAPRALTITINSPDERRPPQTRNVEVDGTRGEVELPTVEPGKAYDIRVSEVSREGLASPAARADLARG